MLVKILASTLVVGGVNVVARANPHLGGWIASLPVVSILSLVWLASDGASANDLTAFVSRVLIGLLPTAALLGIIAFCLAQNLSVTTALACAGLAWAVFTVIARLLGLLA